MYSICLVFVVNIFDAGQLFDDVFKTLTIVESSETLDILQNECFWSIANYVIKNILKDKSAAFLVVKTLLLSSSGERLARESGYVNVDNWHRD